MALMQENEFLSLDVEEQEAENQPKRLKTREKRTKLSQRDIFISFVEQNPEVLDNNDAAYAKKWKILASKLNTIEPKKSTSAWIKNLKEWEYSLKSKYNKAKKNSRVATEMSNFEMRALAAFGIIRLKGNSELSNLFFPETISTSTPTTRILSTQSGANSSLASPDESFLGEVGCCTSLEMEDFVNQHDKESLPQKTKSFDIPVESLEQVIPPKKKSRSLLRDPDMAEILNVLSDQNKVNQKNAQIAEKNAESFATIANSLKDMVGFFIAGNRQTQNKE
ncbi:uncharacterized protein LOC129807781 [Phlebotomus papatasi]|nr:uncharacterized protein LOC129807781 [Phlebotomus papatasi]